MAIIQHEIKEYILYHMTSDFANQYEHSTIINCYDNSASYMGSLYFYEEGAAIPSNAQSSSSGALYLRFHKSQLADMTNTLRLEKPLYIWFNDVLLSGGLKTSREPVGEEES